MVPAGVDLDMFQPGDQRRARDKLGLNGERIVLYVGRMDAIKGLDVLIHSVAFMETPCNLRVLVIGGSNQDREFNKAQKLVNTLGVADKVDLLGTLEHESLPLYYQAADVCVVRLTMRALVWWRLNRWPAAPRWWRRGLAACKR